MRTLPQNVYVCFDFRRCKIQKVVRRGREKIVERLLLGFRVHLLPVGLLVRLQVELCKEDEEESHVTDGDDRVDDWESARVVEEQDQAVAHHSQELEHLDRKIGCFEWNH